MKSTIKKIVEKVLGTTTKQVTWRVLNIWAVAVIAQIVSGFTVGYNFVPLVIAVSATVGIVVSGYFYKSFSENKEEYGNVDPQEVVESVTNMTTQVMETINNMSEN